MNREIKFRAKRLDNGNWIVGNLFIPDSLLKHTHICEKTSYFDFTCGNDEFETDEQFNELIKQGTAIGRFIEVDEKTVGEYTGLKDKNKKDIFEGDLLISTGGELMYSRGEAVKWNKGTVCKVFYKEGKFSLKKIGKQRRMPLQSNNITLNGFEVIGNIHDNPELLTPPKNE